MKLIHTFIFILIFPTVSHSETFIVLDAPTATNKNNTDDTTSIWDTINDYQNLIGSDEKEKAKLLKAQQDQAAKLKAQQDQAAKLKAQQDQAAKLKARTPQALPLTPEALPLEGKENSKNRLSNNEIYKRDYVQIEKATKELEEKIKKMGEAGKNFEVNIIRPPGKDQLIPTLVRKN